MAGSFTVALARVARAAEREHRARGRERERQLRAAERQQVHAMRQAERDGRRMEKDAAAAYLAERRDEAMALTQQADAQVQALYGILSAKPRSTAMSPLTDGTPETVCADVFRLLRRQFVAQTYRSGYAPATRPAEPAPGSFHTTVAPPSFFGAMFGGKAKHAQAVAEASAKDARRLEAAQARWRESLAVWEAEDAAARALDEQRRAEHADQEASRQAEIDAHNAGIDAWEAGVVAQEPDAVVQYLTHILDSSDYPEEFDERYRAAYSPESRALVIEYVLPDPEVVPSVKEYSYVKAQDDFKEKPRPKAESAAIYRAAIAALVLRTIRELYAAAPRVTLETITLNGIIDSIDPATGLAVSPCVISVRTTRDAFIGINLSRVDPAACLASLGASVSRRPEELAPVRPISSSTWRIGASSPAATSLTGSKAWMSARTLWISPRLSLRSWSRTCSHGWVSRPS